MAPRNTTIHILYGIPCAGKSTTALQLASQRNIRTVIHTDYVREIQRGLTQPGQYPALAKVTHNAWELYGSATPQNVVAGFLAHVDNVAVGIRVVVKKLVSDGFEAVIEGCHFHSRIIEDLCIANNRADIQATLLTIETAEELRRRIAEKEKSRAHGSERKQWHANVPVMLVIQEYLVADARSNGIRVVAGDKWRRDW